MISTWFLLLLKQNHNDVDSLFFMYHFRVFCSQNLQLPLEALMAVNYWEGHLGSKPLLVSFWIDIWLITRLVLKIFMTFSPRLLHDFLSDPSLHQNSFRLSNYCIWRSSRVHHAAWYSKQAEFLLGSAWNITLHDFCTTFARLSERPKASSKQLSTIKILHLEVLKGASCCLVQHTSYITTWKCLEYTFIAPNDYYFFTIHVSRLFAELLD